jgi:uncharacterized SAM-binding protein YcdF (DUF218 family)
LGVLVCACVLIALTHQAIFRSLGHYLVESESPEKSDVVIVLAGDYTGQRITRGADLVRQGYAPVALVSGPFELYGMNEADLAIQFAIRRGAPASYFEAVYMNAYSTLAEARAYIPVLQKRKVQTLLLVTSNFHTRRAAETFRRILGPSIKIRSVGAPDRFFDPESWWHNREAQKTVFYEYSRTVGNWVGL